MGSFKAFLVTRNQIPNFSSCLDITLTTVAELLRSSSNFSILPTKSTPESPGLEESIHLLHCRLRITEPITIPPTNNTNCHTKTLFPSPTKIGFWEFKIYPIDVTPEEARHRISAIERKASKSKLYIVSSSCSSPMILLCDWKALMGARRV